MPSVEPRDEPLQQQAPGFLEPVAEAFPAGEVNGDFDLRILRAGFCFDVAQVSNLSRATARLSIKLKFGLN
jgi:hypothetical protein